MVTVLQNSLYSIVRCSVIDYWKVGVGIVWGKTPHVYLTVIWQLLEYWQQLVYRCCAPPKVSDLDNYILLQWVSPVFLKDYFRKNYKTKNLLQHNIQNPYLELNLYYTKHCVHTTTKYARSDKRLTGTENYFNIFYIRSWKVSRSHKTLGLEDLSS